MDVSKKMSIEKEAATAPEWDKAIRDTEEELRLITIQRRGLQQTLRIFKLNKQERVEWYYPHIMK